ncbi:MAG: dihydropteroate synthase [Fuerstiella sp.]
MTDNQFPAWQVADRTLRRTELPLLMGILNVTPDSFSDGGDYASLETAVAHGLMLVDDGADLLDIGGESSRPGAEPVSVDEELSRTIPVIEQLCREVKIPISIDTTKAEVARQAIRAGAAIVNDISGMTFDPDMISVCVAGNVSVVAMHMQGTPQTMQRQPTYHDVVAEVTEYLAERMQVLMAAGIAADRICLDPGIGFGKTAGHNLLLMKAIGQMQSILQRPLLLGHSRKRFLSKVLGRDVEERLAGTIGVSIGLADNGADILRVHDVAATRDGLVARNAVAANSARTQETR